MIVPNSSGEHSRTVASSRSVTRRVFTEIVSVIYYEVWGLGGFCLEIYANGFMDKWTMRIFIHILDVKNCLLVGCRLPMPPFSAKRQYVFNHQARVSDHSISS